MPYSSASGNSVLSKDAHDDALANDLFDHNDEHEQNPKNDQALKRQVAFTHFYQRIVEDFFDDP